MSKPGSDQPVVSELRPISPGSSLSVDAQPGSSGDLDVGGDDAPAETSVQFPIVGVGASAGGLEAVTQLLRALPTDLGASFVMDDSPTGLRQSSPTD